MGAFARSALGIHGLLAAAALLSVVLVIGTRRTEAPSAANAEHIADMAIEHDAPATLTVAASILHGGALIELANTNADAVYISVPSDWQRSEVRNAPLAAVQQEPPMLGYVRWHIPAGARVSFRAPQAPGGVLLHNPNKQPLKVTVILVELEDDTVMQDIVLVYGKAARLW